MSDSLFNKMDKAASDIVRSSGFKKEASTEYQKPDIVREAMQENAIEAAGAGSKKLTSHFQKRNTILGKICYTPMDIEMSPKQICMCLEREIVGQKKVIPIIADAISKKRSLILVGDSGTGRELIIQTVAKCLGRPVAQHRLSDGSVKDGLIFGTSTQYDTGDIGPLLRAVVSKDRGRCFLLLHNLEEVSEYGNFYPLFDQPPTLHDYYMDMDIPLVNTIVVAFVDDPRRLPNEFLKTACTVYLEPYSDKERILICKKIICKKCEYYQKQVFFQDKVIEYLADCNITQSFTYLEKDIEQIVYMAKNGARIDMNAAAKLLCISDPESFDEFSTSVEQLLEYYRFHKKNYSSYTRERIQQLYGPFIRERKRRKGEEDSYYEKALSGILRIRDNRKTDAGIEVIKNAEIGLENSHFGRHKEKNMLLDAVYESLLTGRGNIILLIGPPGTGKTSLLESICKATGLGYARINCESITSIEEMKGYPRHYKGGKPGRISAVLSGICKTQAILLMDEIDKLNDTIALSLLDVFDGDRKLRDDYFETIFDLKDTIFVLTANEYTGIPEPLLNRMDTKIQMRSYSLEEKTEIARSYTLPKLLNKSGLKCIVKFRKDALSMVVNDYCMYDAGARSVEHVLAQVLRGISRNRLVANEEYIVTKEDVCEFAGVVPITQEYQSYMGENKPGVVMGLCVKGSIGMLQPVIVKERKHRLENQEKVTVIGMLKQNGSMMESIEVALEVVSSYIDSEIPPLTIQFPSSIPKDGPSAGAAICSAIMSVVLKMPINAAVAMTGEIDCMGKVYAVGGISAKVTAVLDQYPDCDMIFVPRQNYNELNSMDRIDYYQQRGMSIVPVDTIEDIFRQIFPDCDLWADITDSISENLPERLSSLYA